MSTLSATKTMTFDSGHRLSEYNGKCYQLHGHTYRLEITVSGEVDGLGMIIDFGVIKEIYKTSIESIFDHKTILNKNDTLNQTIFATTPPEWLTWVDYNPTAENITLHIASIFKESLAKSHPKIQLSQITLWETPTSFATIKY